MICKRLHAEALEAYFDNLHVNMKTACPSEFSGNMSSFGTAKFRDSIKSITISDCDMARRWKMCSAFKNAHIDLYSKCGSSSRKGAYYFG